MKTAAFFTFAFAASTQALLLPVAPGVRHPTPIASSRILEDTNEDDFDGKVTPASCVVKGCVILCRFLFQPEQQS
jgi:hypothetical protein